MTKSLVLVATLLFSSYAHAVPRNTVKAHIDKAMKAHKEGKFDVALDELKAAYSLDPKPDLLFAIAQVYVKLDKCDEAVSYYEKFLATTKDPQAKQVVTQAIDACKSKSPTEPKVAPKVEPKIEVVEPKVEPKVEPEPKLEPKAEPIVGGGERKDDPFASGRSTTTKRSPWYKDPLGDALVIGGVAAAVGGFVMFSGAGSASDKADAAADQDDYREHRDNAESKEKLGIVFSVAAGVLITGGVVRYVTRGGGKKQETRVGVTPVRDGGFVTLLGRF